MPLWVQRRPSGFEKLGLWVRVQHSSSIATYSNLGSVYAPELKLRALKYIKYHTVRQIIYCQACQAICHSAITKGYLNISIYLR